MNDTDSVVLLDKPTVKITLNKTKSYFNIIVHAEKYDEEGYNEFLEYFKMAWVYISSEKMVFYLFIEIEGKEDLEFPLDVYIKLIRCISSIDHNIKNNCHCMCILTNGSLKWKEYLDFLTNLIKPPRPLLLTDSKKEAQTFLNSNTLNTSKLLK
jgi:hypothetical protein